MSTRSWRERIEDILDAIAETQLFVIDMTFEQFKADAKTRKAVMTNLAIIGEAAGHVPSEIIAQSIEVPWVVMRSMRNRMVHVYFSIDPKILWDTIQNDLPLLVKPLRRLLAEKGS
jgi:uncharacterized protein with HEPN domain